MQTIHGYTHLMYLIQYSNLAAISTRLHVSVTLQHRSTRRNRSKFAYMCEHLRRHVNYSSK